jgi:hypothetical protein
MFSIIQLDKSDCAEFITKIHYSKRMPIFWQGFGLVEDGMIVGVVVYGQPSPPLQKYAFVDRDFRFFELSRLVVQTKTKNAASFLVGNSIKLLPSPSAVVSFADTAYGHCGIVYQATNWFYTGSTISHSNEYFVDKKWIHELSFCDLKKTKSPVSYAKLNNIDIRKPQPKHRYFAFNGTKLDKRNMLKTLKYPVNRNYPKCDKSMYVIDNVIDMCAPIDIFNM